jgi:hypothetical protein
MKPGILKRASSVFDDVEQISQAKLNVMKGFLVIGRILREIRESGNWRQYSSHLEDFDDFLIEIRIGRSTAYNCMGIWERFGKYLQEHMVEVDYFRLVRLLPVVKEGEDIEMWITKAQELPPSAFEDEVREAKGLVPRGECSHRDCDWYKHCKVCNKIFPDNSKK